MDFHLLPHLGAEKTVVFFLSTIESCSLFFWDAILRCFEETWKESDLLPAMILIFDLLS